MSDHTILIIWGMKIIFVQFFCVLLHLFLISYASLRSILFLSFIKPIFAWNVPLVSPIFLKRSLVFPILLISSISLHWSLKKAFLSLLAILWNSAFRCLYLSFSPWLFVSLLFSDLDIYKTFYPKASEYTLFQSTHRTCPRIDHILDHKTSLN